MILTALILAAWLPNMDSLEGSEERGSRSLELSEPIHLYEDPDLASEASANGWPGSGSQVDPYIIQDLDIDGTGNSYGLFIGHIESHLVIRNCTIHDADTASSPQYRGNGIYMIGSANITIEECTIINNNASGIFVRMSNNLTIDNNLVSGVPNGSGIYLWEVENSTVTGNTVHDTHYFGITLQTVKDCDVIDNMVYDIDSTGMSLSSSNDILLGGNSLGPGTSIPLILNHGLKDIILHSNELSGGRIALSNDPVTPGGLTIPPNNTVNGNPIYYYHNSNELDANVPSNAGQVILAKVTHLNLSGLDMSGSGVPITISQSSDILIEESRIVDADEGIRIIESHDIDISSIRVEGISMMGVNVHHSNDISIVGSTFNLVDTPVHLNDIQRVSVMDSIFRQNGEGIKLRDGDHIDIVNNSFSDIQGNTIYAKESSSINLEGNMLDDVNNERTGDAAIVISSSRTGTIQDNTFTGAYGCIAISGKPAGGTDLISIENNILMDNIGIGIHVSGAENIEVSGNLIFNSSEEGVAVASTTDSRFFNNTLIFNNNSTGEYQTTAIQASDDNSGNSWDMDSEGNYWRDHLAPDADGDGIVDDPYLIFGGSNFDQYPLTSPTYEYLSEPEDLTAGANQTGITLTWSPPSFDLDGSLSGYILSRTLNNGTDLKMWEIYDTEYFDSEVANGITYVYQVVAVSRLGQGTPSGTVRSLIDSSAPVVRITSPNASVIGSSDLNFTWEATDNVGIDHIEISLDEMEWIEVGLNRSYSMTDLSEGNHIFRVRAFDGMGNEQTAWIEFYVDISDPVVSIVSPENGFITSNSSIRIEWTGHDMITSMDHYRMRIENGNWMELGNANNTTITLEFDGEFTVYIEGIDQAGNVGESSMDLIFDRTGPEIYFTYPPDDLTTLDTSLNVSWGSLDILSGVSGYSLIIDEGEPADLPNNVTEYHLTDLDVGDHVLRIIAFDLAGNSNEAEVTFVVESDWVIITGTVLDEDGDPVQKVTVTSESGESTETDSLGNFVLEVPRGNWKLTFEKDDFHTFDVFVDTTSGEPLTIDDVDLEEKDDDDRGFFRRMMDRLLCQICCGAMIVIPILLLLLGIRRRARSKRMKKKKAERRRRSSMIRDIEE